MSLRISLLGPVKIRRDDKPLILPGYRPLALLAYLLITGKPHSREHLANLLFDRPGDPRASLRWTVLQIRKTLGKPVITADRHEITFNFQSDYWFDVAALEGGDLDCYSGDLLEGLSLRNARQYEAWLLVERERLRAQYQSGLEQHLWELREAGVAAAIETTALKLLQLDNLREDWHQVLMSAYASQGKFEAAQAQYELCRQILREELATDLAPETVSLAQEIERRQAELYRSVVVGSPLLLEPSGRTEQSDRNTPKSAAKETIGSVSNQSEKSQARSLKRTGTLALAGMILLAIIATLGIINSREPAGSAVASGNIDDTTSVASIDPDNGTLLTATADPGSETLATADLTGTSVTIMGPFTAVYADMFRESLAPFEERSGTIVELVSRPIDFESVLPSVVASESRPDIVMFPQPGFLAEFVRKGDVVDVRTFLDTAYLRQQYGDGLLQAALMEGQMVGVWHSTYIKSLVWYPKHAFDDAGYEVPRTWEELMVLSDQIVADGVTPWCIGVDDRPLPGWVGTDWVEEILLRTSSLETYDAWTAGELPFDSPQIRRAFTITGEIWLKEGYVYGGPARIVSEGFDVSALHLFEDPPPCFLHRQGSFILRYFPQQVNFGRDYDFFYLPPIDAIHGRPVLGGGDIMAMFNDRPEVREVMRYLTTAESVRYLVERGAVISPHRDAPFEWYSDPVSLKISQILFEADAFRFDGSDMMPAEVGTGTFWQGIVDWVEGEELDSVLQEIDESWPREE